MNSMKSLIANGLFAACLALASMAAAAQPAQAAEDAGRARFFTQAAVHIGMAGELARLCPAAKVSLDLEGAVRKGLAGNVSAIGKFNEAIASVKEVSTAFISRAVERAEGCKGEPFNDLLAYVERENDTLMRQWGKKEW
jgi:hypothetical protein